MHPWHVQTEGTRFVDEGLVASGAPLSFDDFFLDQQERLYRALYFVTGSRHDAEELMQDAFLKLWERWDRIGEIEDAEGYLYRIALNGFRMRVRRAKVAARHLVPMGRSLNPFEEVDVKEDVRQLLTQLSVRQRAAILLTDVYGYGSEQAGTIMGIRPATVRVLASQGRATLRARRNDDA
jgi:RNA polymerase sigma-70 factor (ECF subfamily)